jgi:hypothetical protein
MMPDISGALVRIQVEYVEMPGLKLTPSQAGRLCGLPVDVCRVALVALAASGFLRRDDMGAYVRSGASPMPVGTLDPRTWSLGIVGA